jgi:hypothetical protein
MIDGVTVDTADFDPKQLYTVSRSKTGDGFKMCIQGIFIAAQKRNISQIHAHVNDTYQSDDDKDT